MPPAVSRAFGFVAKVGDQSVALDKHGNVRYQGGDKLLEDGKAGRRFHGMGSDMGTVTDPDLGKEVDAGKLLMRDQWNSDLFTPLNKMYEEGKKLQSRPDVWIHKNRMRCVSSRKALFECDIY